MSARSILQKAYRKVDEKLSKSGSSKPIDDLVKLMKLERELGPEKQATKEIKVRWEENEEKPSNDE